MPSIPQNFLKVFSKNFGSVHASVGKYIMHFSTQKWGGSSGFYLRWSITLLRLVRILSRRLVRRVAVASPHQSEYACGTFVWHEFCTLQKTQVWSVPQLEWLPFFVFFRAKLCTLISVALLWSFFCSLSFSSFPHFWILKLCAQLLSFQNTVDFALCVALLEALSLVLLFLSSSKGKFELYLSPLIIPWYRDNCQSSLFTLRS